MAATQSAASAAQPLKDVVYSQHGMACSTQQAASQIGVRVLEQGGSAADACVAMAAALCVTEPMSTGVGGDMFALYWDSKEQRVQGLNGSGKSSKNATLESVRRDVGLDVLNIPRESGHSITVPGSVAGWVDLHSRYGKLPMKTVLAPARELASDGFLVHTICAGLWKNCEEYLLERGSTELLNDQNRAPKAGDLFKFPGLAKVFDLIGHRGKSGFYEGAVAEAIVKAVRENGGLICKEDLKMHTSKWVDPISIEFEDHTIWEIPPNGQGIVALMALNILRHTDLRDHKIGTTGFYHTMIEALRIGFAEAKAGVVSCPDANNIDFDHYLSENFGRSRASEIRPNQAMKNIAGSPIQTCDTVYLCAADQYGNACSFIHSVYRSFGSGIVAKGFDFALQNRGENFVLQPGHPNCFAPSKRPYHTIIPGMITKGDELVGPFGVMGGFMQPQGHVQVLVSALQRGLSPQQALNRPRFCIQPTGEVCVEASLGEDVIEELRKIGHTVEIVEGIERGTFGRGQIIIKKDSVWIGATENRADGCALASRKFFSVLSANL